jgi:hypothetical protein
MAKFTIETKNLFKLQVKFADAADEFKKFAIKELNESVKIMEADAKKKSSPSKLPRININSTYKRTGKLSGSISSEPFDGRYATLILGRGINYAPYVEFGTGSGYGFPYKVAANFRNRLDSLASTYKGSGQRNNNMPARPFFFNTINNGRNSLFRKLKNFK